MVAAGIHAAAAAVHAWSVPWQAALASALTLVLVLYLRRRQVEDALRHAGEQQARSERFFRALIEKAFDAVLIVDSQSTITYASPALERVTGYSRTTLEGDSLYSYAVPGTVPPDARFRDLLATPGAVVLRQFVHADGSIRDMEMLVTNLLDDPAVAGIVINCRDVTATSAAQRAVESSRNDLRELTRRHYADAEEERRRVSRDVHDVIGQQVTALSLDIAWLQRHVGDADTRLVLERLAAMSQVARDAAASVRQVARELRAGMPEGLNLGHLMEKLGGDFGKRSGVRIVLELEAVSAELDHDRATAVVRIVQEALNNVLRHAGANRVRLTLREERGMGVVEVHDNGRGMPPGAAGAGLGLSGMRERALAVGGSVHTGSSVDGGAMVRVEVPL